MYQSRTELLSDCICQLDATVDFQLVARKCKSPTALRSPIQFYTALFLVILGNDMGKQLANTHHCWSGNMQQSGTFQQFHQFITRTDPRNYSHPQAEHVSTGWLIGIPLLDYSNPQYISGSLSSPKESSTRVLNTAHLTPSFISMRPCRQFHIVKWQWCRTLWYHPRDSGRENKGPTDECSCHSRSTLWLWLIYIYNDIGNNNSDNHITIWLWLT